MRRILLIASVALLMTTATARAQIGSPGIEYSGTIAAGDGVQMYPYDQQDPWLHGHFQRYPAYGGFASFRPYNYRHVFAQTQIAARSGAAHGMPYSQQFWNKYRGNYLNGNLHSQLTPPQGYPGLPYAPQAYPMFPQTQPAVPVSTAGVIRSIGYQPQEPLPFSDQAASRTDATGRPIHIFPGQ